MVYARTGLNPASGVATRRVSMYGVMKNRMARAGTVGFPVRAAVTIPLLTLPGVVREAAGAVLFARDVARGGVS